MKELLNWREAHAFHVICPKWNRARQFKPLNKLRCSNRKRRDENHLLSLSTCQTAQYFKAKRQSKQHWARACVTRLDGLCSCIVFSYAIRIGMHFGRTYFWLDSRTTSIVSKLASTCQVEGKSPMLPPTGYRWPSAPSHRTWQEPEWDARSRSVNLGILSTHEYPLLTPLPWLV